MEAVAMADRLSPEIHAPTHPENPVEWRGEHLLTNGHKVTTYFEKVVRRVWECETDGARFWWRLIREEG